MSISGRIVRMAVILALALAGNSWAEYSGGSGAVGEPYEIGTVIDWEYLMERPADWDKYFILTADLDVNGVGLSPVGNDVNNFTGVFDGNDHIIRNADINTPDANYVGLFGYVGQYGQIGSLGVESIVIEGKDYVGGLAGRVNGGNIVLCYTTGSVAGVSNVGGLAGYGIDGIVTACYSTASVLGISSFTGGLVGQINFDTLTACYATGEVTGDSYVGGLVGMNWGTATACYATGAVTGDFVVGGLVGYNAHSIYSSYSTGLVSGSPYVGGLIGSTSSRSGYSHACFWDKDTSGRTISDGGEGKTTDQMQDPNTFLAAGWDFSDEDGDPADWFMPEDGYPLLAFSSWVWTKVPDITGMSLLDAAAALRNAGLLVGSSEWVAGEAVPPGHIVSHYPSGGFKGVQGVTGIDLRISIATEFSGGDGSADDPYQIRTAAEWALLADSLEFWYDDLTLIADIDFAGATVSPIGDDRNSFSGVMNGNGHVVRNIRVNMPGATCVGLFGCLPGYRARGQIRNLGVENISVVGDEYVGGLVGYSGDDYISGCYVTGEVSGYKYVGGLVGYGYKAMISTCYTDVTVSGNSLVGGLVGYNSAHLSACYSIGQVNGDSYVGGLVGHNPDSLDADGCFWDVNSSGQSGSAAGVGKTTAEMKDIETYPPAEWDFTTEDFDPADWVMPANDYPRLAWEYWEDAPIPDVNGMPFDQAASDLKAAGFFVGSLSGIVSGTVPVSCVVQQSPPADSNGIQGVARVDMVISYRDEFADGNGSEDDPYEIAGVDDWVLLTDTPESWSDHFILTADLDFFGGGMPPVVSTREAVFDGLLDGNDHTVRNVFVNVQEGVPSGLVTYLYPNGQIRNVRVEDIYIIVPPDPYMPTVGGLVGTNDGTITNCHLRSWIDGSEPSSWSRIGSLVGENNGTITACSGSGRVGNSDYVGGLVGRNRGNITDCYADTNIWGSEGDSGGLVGYNYDGDIANSCATGDSIAGGRTAGLVGRNGGSITNCYAAGSVIDGPYAGGLVAAGDSGSVSASFWDKDTSGQATSAVGEGKATAQMQDPNTFISAGWDFVGEAANGTDDIWAICEGTNYPRLVWRIPSVDWVCPDGVGFEDFSYLGGLWGTGEAGPANLDGEDGIGFGDLMIFCEEWLSGR